MCVVLNGNQQESHYQNKLWLSTDVFPAGLKPELASLYVSSPHVLGMDVCVLSHCPVQSRWARG